MQLSVYSTTIKFSWNKYVMEWCNVDKNEKFLNQLNRFTFFSSLRLEMEVRCLEYWWGTDCGTYCRPRDSHSGHYTCSQNGTKICLPGKIVICTQKFYFVENINKNVFIHFHFSAMCLMWQFLRKYVWCLKVKMNAFLVTSSRLVLTNEIDFRDFDRKILSGQ